MVNINITKHTDPFGRIGTNVSRKDMDYARKREDDGYFASLMSAYYTPNFPTLTGSEKQISWANDIRQKQYDSLMGSYLHALVRHLDQAANLDPIKAVIEQVFAKTDAKYWIESRFDEMTIDSTEIQNLVKKMIGIA